MRNIGYFKKTDFVIVNINHIDKHGARMNEKENILMTQILVNSIEQQQKNHF